MAVKLTLDNTVDMIMSYAQDESPVSIRNLKRYSFYTGVIDRMAQRKCDEEYMFNMSYITPQNIKLVHKHIKIRLGDASFRSF
jgi:hypothetical protein